MRDWRGDTKKNTGTERNPAQGAVTQQASASLLGEIRERYARG